MLTADETVENPVQESLQASVSMQKFAYIEMTEVFGSSRHMLSNPVASNHPNFGKDHA